MFYYSLLLLNIKRFNLKCIFILVVCTFIIYLFTFFIADEIMADVFDIDSGSYHDRKKNSDGYNHRGGWVPVDLGGERRKDPRLARRDDGK